MREKCACFGVLIIIGMILCVLHVNPLAASEVATFTWTPLDQLATADTPAAQLSFTYDGDGNRVSKSDGAETVVYIRDHSGNVIAEYDGSGTLLAEYIYADGRRIAKVVAGQRYYYHTDLVETPLVITDENGNLAWRGESLPFGVEVASGDHPDSYKFGGKELDPETGLLYFGSRYYNPYLGRFISPDPIRGDIKAPQRLNRYAFSLNNPLGYVDPNGADPRPGGPEQMPRGFMTARPFDAGIVFKDATISVGAGVKVGKIINIGVSMGVPKVISRQDVGNGYTHIVERTPVSLGLNAFGIGPKQDFYLIREWYAKGDFSFLGETVSLVKKGDPAVDFAVARGIVSLGSDTGAAQKGESEITILFLKLKFQTREGQELEKFVPLPPLPPLPEGLPELPELEFNPFPPRVEPSISSGN